ncbi:Ig-like domain-containing protein, partial [Pseudoalteromonas sp. bablab_jr011]
VPSNITVVALDDMVTTEETAISFDVHYIDETNSKNEISVISDNVSFEVDGDTVTVTPNENFYGETEVTVVVSDIENPSDAASTTFMLTVEGLNDAPVVSVEASAQQMTEGGVLTLDASASHDLDNDELTFSWEGPGVIASPTSAVTEVSGLSVGEHQFTVTVSDGVDAMELGVSVTVTA